MSSESSYKTIAQLADFPKEEGRAFEVGGRMVAVFRTSEGLKAIDDMCPHMGASLATGHFEAGEVSCPWHAWRFDVSDGSWCDNRRLKIDVFDVRLEGEDVQIRVDSEGQPVVLKEKNELESDTQ